VNALRAALFAARFYHHTMKLAWLALIFAGASMPLLAVEVGDTYQKVVEEKGAPASKVEAGSTAILRYVDMTIKLQDGKVVSIKLAGEIPSVSSEKKVEQKPKPAVNPGEWTTDYAAALQQAKSDRRLVFLFFTGSDWCGWCKRLDAEILSTGEFINYARNHLILVKLDFPRTIPQPAQIKARNDKLARQYGIDRYPTVIVLNDSGKMVGQLGYQEGGPKPFIKALAGF
jgi:thioredoxin-related protein